MSITPTVQNKKAHRNYEVQEKFQVGIVLTGTEIKSIRAGRITLTESYIDVDKVGELFLINSYVEEYSQGNRFNHDPSRKRKLLAHKSEILKMKKAKEMKGLTIIPLKLYFNRNLAKLEIGLCRGKDTRDKRQDIMKREEKIKMERILKNF